MRSTDLARSEDWRVSTSADPATSLRWSPAGKQLFYVDNNYMMAAPGSTSPSFVAGTPRALFSAVGLKPAFDLGPDERFLMIRRRPGLRPPTQLEMLERWTDLIRDEHRP